MDVAAVMFRNGAGVLGLFLTASPVRSTQPAAVAFFSLKESTAEITKGIHSRDPYAILKY